MTPSWRLQSLLGNLCVVHFPTVLGSIGMYLGPRWQMCYRGYTVLLYRRLAVSGLKFFSRLRARTVVVPRLTALPMCLWNFSFWSKITPISLSLGDGQMAMPFNISVLEEEMGWKILLFLVKCVIKVLSGRKIAPHWEAQFSNGFTILLCSWCTFFFL